MKRAIALACGATLAIASALVGTGLVSARTSARPGEPDPTFGSGGFVLTDFGPGRSDGAVELAVQPDGMIVAFGTSEDREGSEAEIALARYLPDGRLDPRFGAGGLVEVRGVDNVVRSGLLQPDGRMVVAGVSTASGQQDFFLARFRRDGTPDPTFGSTGRVLTDVGPVRDDLDFGEAVLRQSDGKLIVVGQTRGRHPHRDFAVLRYTRVGRLDRRFGTRGIVRTDVGGRSDEWAEAVATQPDGKILVGGGILAKGSAEFALVRYRPDGRLDPGFGNRGVVLTDVGSGFGEIRALKLMPDRKIVAVGRAQAGTGYSAVIVRYRPDGRLDRTFGGDGKVITPVAFARAAGGLAAVLQRDGKLVLAGGNGERFLLARYLGNGDLDLGFGDQGFATPGPTAGREEAASAVVLQRDGKIVIAGTSGPSAGAEGASDFAIARYTAAETP